MNLPNIFRHWFDISQCFIIRTRSVSEDCCSTILAAQAFSISIAVSKSLHTHSTLLQLLLSLVPVPTNLRKGITTIISPTSFSSSWENVPWPLPSFWTVKEILKEKYQCQLLFCDYDVGVQYVVEPIGAATGPSKGWKGVTFGNTSCVLPLHRLRDTPSLPCCTVLYCLIIELLLADARHWAFSTPGPLRRNSPQSCLMT